MLPKEEFQDYLMKYKNDMADGQSISQMTNRILCAEIAKYVINLKNIRKVVPTKGGKYIFSMNRKSFFRFIRKELTTPMRNVLKKDYGISLHVRKKIVEFTVID